MNISVATMEKACIYTTRRCKSNEVTVRAGVALRRSAHEHNPRDDKELITGLGSQRNGIRSAHCVVDENSWSRVATSHQCEAWPTPGKSHHQE